MSVAGIIAEFNPLHNGHKYLIDCAKSENDFVVCVISGNFVQRGDVAIIPKFKRAEAALLCGADLVLELPVPWSMSTAQNFALGGVSQLAALGVDTLYFGSECGDSALLERIADVIASEEFNAALKNELNRGETFAKTRTEVLKSFCGNDAEIICNPNDTLATEYITAAKKLGLNLKFRAIKRLGAGHDSVTANSKFASSSLIRSFKNEESLGRAAEFMPAESYKALIDSPIASIEKIDTAIMCKLKLSDEDLFGNLPDVSEGLDRLIVKNLKNAYSFEELCDAIKSKRYTRARIRRILLSAFLGIDDSYFLKEPPYVRVLGVKKDAFSLISCENKPIITKVSQISELDTFSKKVFELENKVNEAYALSLSNPKLFKNEFTEKLIKM